MFDYYSVIELDDFGILFEDIYNTCCLQGVSMDTAISEAGCRQFEINLNYAVDPLHVAYDAIFFKNIIKGIARKHGLSAIFMAKPYSDLPGNDFHVHFSLMDDQGNNVFSDGTEKSAEILQHTIAGLIDAMPEMTAMFALHFCPDSYASIAQAWAHENRTTAIHNPADGSSIVRCIEYRIAGADANPYLVLSTILDEDF